MLPNKYDEGGEGIAIFKCSSILYMLDIYKATQNLHPRIINQKARPPSSEEISQRSSQKGKQ